MSSASAVSETSPPPRLPRVLLQEAVRDARALIRHGRRAPIASSPRTNAITSTIAAAIRTGEFGPSGAATCPWRPAHDVLSELLDIVRCDDPSVHPLLMSERFALVRWLDAMETPRRIDEVRRMRRCRDTIIMRCVTALCRNDDVLWPFLRDWASPFQWMLDDVVAARAAGRNDPLRTWTERLRCAARDDTASGPIH